MRYFFDTTRGLTAICLGSAEMRKALEMRRLVRGLALVRASAPPVVPLLSAGYLQ